jgi:hypothetical protein
MGFALGLLKQFEAAALAGIAARCNLNGKHHRGYGWIVNRHSSNNLSSWPFKQVTAHELPDGH